MRFQVLMVASMKIRVFWAVVPCSVGVLPTFQRCILPPIISTASPEGSNFNGICLAAKFCIFFTLLKSVGQCLFIFKKGPFAVSDEMYLLIDRSGPVWSFF
jgi:hypothetical protein